ncbi:hypothetical protein DEU56DRAFT_929013 [Suillus clintonianus]|uniref:uncharacterized protein n=1 Tax=Suillus clintonianus TaxID=1904413 RepID=UPI001B874826|nr:uncharacterized protein DEU56DRAFT_929013 [Suillus clintonianus]KAG2119360.1 hypothetical protein DEU56DRAFT_929013 [Suillus clintonianus]
MNASKPDIHHVNTAPPDPAATEQFFHITTPIIPGQIKRSGSKKTQGLDIVVYEVLTGPLDCSKEFAPVPGWEPLTHPEGALFFYHSNRKVFTYANIQGPGTAVEMDEIAKKAYEEAHKANVFRSSVELTLERMMVGEDEKWGYYFADHDKRVVFWLKPYKSEELIGNVRGVNGASHIKYALESQYWFVASKKHIELFPNKRFLPKDIVVRLREIVMYTQADSITSETCLTPLSSNQIASTLSLMDPLMSSIGQKHEHSVWIVARFMGHFCHMDFVNFCGQPGARLDAKQSLYGDSNMHPKNFFFRIMNIILFGSLDAHSRALHLIWVDHTIVQRRWKDFINGLNNEWNGYTIFSTVMLAVDISFLAITSVQTQPHAILVSYLSILCAMGSLVVSLVLAAQVNDGRRSSAESAASFMVGMSYSMLGIESLALMLTLPYALLLWGMTFFAVALLMVIVRTSGVVTVSIVSPMWVAVVIVAAWPILAANGFHMSRLFSWVFRRRTFTLPR